MQITKERILNKERVSRSQKMTKYKQSRPTRTDPRRNKDRTKQEQSIITNKQSTPARNNQQEVVEIKVIN